MVRDRTELANQLRAAREAEDEEKRKRQTDLARIYELLADLERRLAAIEGRRGPGRPRKT